MTLLRILALAVLLAMLTMFVAWWTVPAVAAAYALLRRSSSAPGEAALAALLAWGALLARVAMVPAFTTLLARIGPILQIPGFALTIVALVFAMALSWSAARLVTALVGRPAKSA